MSSDVEADLEAAFNAPPSAEGERSAGGGSGSAGGRNRSANRQGQKWSRLLHVYTSMICFVVVLFFAVTGVTLNHPTWVFGSDGRASPATARYRRPGAVAPPSTGWWWPSISGRLMASVGQ